MKYGCRVWWGLQRAPWVPEGREWMNASGRMESPNRRVQRGNRQGKKRTATAGGLETDMIVVTWTWLLTRHNTNSVSSNVR